MVYRIFTELAIITMIQFQNIFISPQSIPLTINSHSPSLPSAPDNHISTFHLHDFAYSSPWLLNIGSSRDQLLYFLVLTPRRSRSMTFNTIQTLIIPTWTSTPNARLGYLISHLTCLLGCLTDITDINMVKRCCRSRICSTCMVFRSDYNRPNF